MPVDWKSAIINLIAKKKGDVKEVRNSKLISLLCTVHKLFTNAEVNQISNPVGFSFIGNKLVYEWVSRHDYQQVQNSYKKGDVYRTYRRTG